MMPGDPLTYYIGGASFTEEDVEKLKNIFGLDKPITTQFWLFLRNTLMGEFGLSYKYYPRAVWDILVDRVPWTLLLMGCAIILQTVVGIFLGIFCAWKRGSKWDISIQTVTLLLYSVPAFWIGMILLFYFSYVLGWFPLFGNVTPGATYTNFFAFAADVARHAILPIITLTCVLLASRVLIMRYTMLEVLEEDYIMTARAKGLSERRVMFSHAARNALLPTVTDVGLTFGIMMGGAVLTETVFSYPGMGRLMFEAVSGRDYPLLQATFFLVAVCVVIANFVVDLIYTRLDPRIRL